MVAESSQYLTVRELAALLRVKERKVYALAASGEIPCSRATGKLIFPRASVQAWLDGHSRGGEARPAATGSAAPTVFAGSHDPLLDWALRESRSGIAAFFDGSLDGLARLGAGGAMAAGLHLHDEGADDWNRAALVTALPEAPLVLLEWAWRERGLIVPAGSPRALAGLADLTGRKVMPRQPEAGSQLLFEALLRREGLDKAGVEWAAPPARSEADVALAVADGKAEAGFGLAAAARQFRLDFIPLLRERFDLAVMRRAYFEPPFQRLMAFCRTPAFAAKAAELGGYDIAGFGQVHHNGP